MRRRPKRLVHFEELWGRKVRASNGVVIGRLQDVRVDQHGDDYEVTEYLIARGSLLHRLPLLARLCGRPAGVLVARWDQLDIENPQSPMLTCPVGELQRLD